MNRIILRKKANCIQCGLERRCKKCNTLLGVEREGRLIVKYKEHASIFSGGTTTLICRNCDSIQEIVIGQATPANS